MTLLSFSNGESFAPGAIGYDYRPATKADDLNIKCLHNKAKIQ